jgi:putative ABC transport system permease protein
VDGIDLAWTLLITIGAAVLFGLAPGFNVSGSNLQEALKDSSPGMTGSRKQDAMRAALVISEFALARVPLIGAGTAAKLSACPRR